MNQFYISEHSSRNSEISEINEADLILWFLQKNKKSSFISVTFMYRHS